MKTFNPKFKYFAILTFCTAMLAFTPVHAQFTTGGNNYATLEAAAAAVADGGTIMMTQDVTLNSSVELSHNKTYTIDLGGYTLSSADWGVLYLQTAGTVTIQNGSIINTNPMGIGINVYGSTYDGVTAILDDLTVRAEFSAVDNYGTLSILSGNYYGFECIAGLAGTVIITSGYFEATGDYGCLNEWSLWSPAQILLAPGSFADVEPWKNNPDANNVTITATGTQFANFSTGGNIYATLAEAAAAVEDGGTITMLQDIALSATVKLNQNKTYTIDFGGYTCNAFFDYALTIDAGTVTLQNGTLTNTKLFAIWVNSDAVLITDALTISTTNTAINNNGTTHILSGNYTNISCSGGTVTIASGNFNGRVSCSGGTITITSGHFRSFSSSGVMVESGSGQIILAEGSYPNVSQWKNNRNASNVTIMVGMPENFSTGENIYATLQEAAAAVENGGIITMLQDVAQNWIIELDQDKTYIIDLNGYTFTNSDYIGLDLLAGTVTIRNGNIIDTYSPNDGVSGAIRVGSAATVILDGLTVTGRDTGVENWGTLSILSGDYSGRQSAIFCIAGTVTITSGHFTITSSISDYTALLEDTERGGQIVLAEGVVADVENWKNDGSVKNVTITVATNIDESPVTDYERRVVGYYSILGQKLPQEPEKGLYIILYDNGKTEKVMK